MTRTSLPRPGDGPPSRMLAPTLDDLARWAEAAEDPTAFHLDEADAAAHGFGGPVVHGPYLSARVAGMLVDWLGPGAVLRTLACRYRRPAIAGDSLRCTAVITRVEPGPDGTGWTATLEVAVEREPGEAIVTGEATAVVR